MSEYSVEAYLQRQPLEKLEKFLQDYLDGVLEDDFSSSIGLIAQEIARKRKQRREQIAQLEKMLG